VVKTDAFFLFKSFINFKIYFYWPFILIKIIVKLF
jgi:hypothetical protein